MNARRGARALPGAGGPSRRWLRRGMVIAVFVIGAAMLAHWFAPAPRQPKSYLATEVLVLGDSQLSFGAGPVLSRFFGDMTRQCASAMTLDATTRRLLADKRFAMIGTRSTSLQSWTTSAGRAWQLLCHRDKKWGVNASAWGTVKPANKRYVQIGEGAAFQVCRPGATPLQQLFATGYYAPELLMVFVGGNGAARLAADKRAAKRDVRRLIDTLPADTGCIFMMTAPIFRRPDNDTRAVAQGNLRAAFAEHNGRCSFVDGHTSDTRAAIEGRQHFFRRDHAGAVKDPYHANEAAAERFLALRRPALCQALITQLLNYAQ